MTRDPRINPQPGDVLNDDPPAPPLVVWQNGRAPDFVGAARYTTVLGHETGCVCGGCACTFSGSWPIDAWRREMADAEVMWTAEQGPAPYEVMWQTIDGGGR